MKKTILTVVIATLLFACENNEQPKSDYPITGDLTNLNEGTMIYLDYLSTTQIIPKDSCTVDMDGHFGFNNPINDLGYYRLRINNQNFINLVLEKGEKLNISGDANNLTASYKVDGSEESKQLKEVNEIYKNHASIQDSLNQIYQSNPTDNTLLQGLQIAAFEATANMNSSIASMINEHPSSLASLAAVELLDPEKNYELLKKVDQALQTRMPEMDYYKKFHQKLEKINQLAIGSSAPDIVLKDVNDNMLSLSSLRGKVVLIDFWASWCRPCRAENPNVVAAYNKYNKLGFDVFSVSLDGMPQQQTAKQDWINAIEKDGLIWKNHVSDLKGWSSVVVPLYGFQGIPFTVLLDKEGNVVGKNIRGQELHQKLAEILGS